MSNKNEKKGPRRPYKLKARARRRDEVHRRITIAAVHLHETVGPAKTTMEAIAKHAGVQRATVYNHFATERELIDACSSHWIEKNPPPDPATWLDIQDPAARTRTAVAAMYAYFESGKEMLEKVLSDAAVVPALAEINNQKWYPMIEQVVNDLAEGLDGRGAKIRATLRVALDFFTWQTLIDSGLSNEEAARLATSWLRASAD